MVKIAFLLMCHRNAEQVNRLIKRLATENRDFYVHVDSKSSIYDEIEWSKQVIPAKRRIDVQWGNITQCDTEITLIETVLEAGKEYDYYWLISGQDYPIKSNDQIDAFLSENRGTNYIEIIDTTALSHLTKVKRNELYYPQWMVQRNLFCKIIKKAYSIISGGDTTVPIFKRRNITGLDFRFGANWFCLTSECVKYVYEQLRDRPEIYKFFRNSLNPDECFLQTLIANSPFVKSVKKIPLYVDWSEMKPNPKMLGNDDLEALMVSDNLIARKFDTITVEIEALSNTDIPESN